MVRTKAGSVSIKAVKGGKRPKNAPKAVAPSVLSSSGSNKNKHSGGNSYHPRETPGWQKPITSFLKQESDSSKDESSMDEDVLPGIEAVFAMPGISGAKKTPKNKTIEKENIGIDIEKKSKKNKKDNGESSIDAQTNITPKKKDKKNGYVEGEKKKKKRKDNDSSNIDKEKIIKKKKKNDEDGIDVPIEVEGNKSNTNDSDIDVDKDIEDTHQSEMEIESTDQATGKVINAHIGVMGIADSKDGNKNKNEMNVNNYGGNIDTDERGDDCEIVQWEEEKEEMRQDDDRTEDTDEENDSDEQEHDDEKNGVEIKISVEDKGKVNHKDMNVEAGGKSKDDNNDKNKMNIEISNGDENKDEHKDEDQEKNEETAIDEEESKDTESDKENEKLKRKYDDRIERKDEENDNNRTQDDGQTINVDTAKHPATTKNKIDTEEDVNND